MGIRTAIIILLLSVCAFGADSVVTVGESDADYTSAKAAFDAEQQDVTLFDGTDLLVFQFTGSWSAVDSNGLPSVNGYTVDTDNHIKLLGVGDARCNGVFSETAYRSVSKNLNNYHAMDINEDYTEIDGLQFEFHRTGDNTGSPYCLYIGSSNKVMVSNSYIRRTPGDTISGASYGLLQSDVNDTIYIFNNLFDGFNDNTGSYAVYTLTDVAAAYIYNNTFAENSRGIYMPSGGRPVVINNIFTACSTAFEAGSPAASSDYNATDSSQFNVTWGSGNTNDSVNAVYNFTDAGGNDWHWASAFAGADLTEDEFLAVTHDIDGDERTVPVDRSFDEYVAGAPAEAEGRRRREERRR